MNNHPPYANERLICLDLETYHTRDPRIIEAIENEAREKRPANNTLKELKLTWDTEQARADRAVDAISKTSVDPLYAEVLCVAIAHGADSEKQYVMNCMENEAAGLEDLRNALEVSASEDTVWVGHNIESFDLPILLNRWRHYGITPPKHFPVFAGGFWRGRVYDTMRRIPSKTGYVSLDAACDVYAIEEGKSPYWNGMPMDGSRVADAYEQGLNDLILEYCLSDIIQTVHLYQVMTAGDTWGTYDHLSTIGEQITEVDASGLSEAQRALAKIRILEAAGLVPRA